MISLLLCFVLLGVSWAAPQAELIQSLPNLDEPMRSQQYSGYLNISQSKSLYYWYVESENNPTKDPVVLWLNGGPGCSSLEGLFVEMGPYRTTDHGATIRRNPWTWNRYASIIYMDAPAGVGFSYRTGNQSNFNYTDPEVAADNHAAIAMWFKKFPERAANPFYVMGESYGGTYVPMLSALLVKDKTFPQFKGMMIGNGCVDDQLNFNTGVNFNYYHGLADEGYYRQTVSQCCKGASVIDGCDFYSMSNNVSDPCYDAVNYLNEAMYYTGLDPYFLYYSCYLTPSDQPNYGTPVFDYRTTILRQHMRKTGSNLDTAPLPSCSHYDDATTYLQRDDLRKALHIPDYVQKYQSCSDSIASNYDFGASHVSSGADNVRAVVNAGKKVALFNGDTDSICNNVHNSQFVANLGYPKIGNETTWSDVSQKPATIGMITKYKGIDYLTVRGAGHFVSSSNEKPKEALQMFYNFVNNKDYSAGITSDVPYVKKVATSATILPAVILIVSRFL